MTHSFPQKSVDIPDIEQGQQDNHVDRILLPVPTAIYNNCMENPAMRWSFEMGISAVSDPF